MAQVEMVVVGHEGSMYAWMLGPGNELMVSEVRADGTARRLMLDDPWLWVDCNPLEA